MMQRRNRAKTVPEPEKIEKQFAPETFKALYGHGTEHKFVKLLFLLLKKQIARYVEHKNA